MNCFFCDGPHVAPVYNRPFRDFSSYSIGTMTLTRRYDGEPMIEVKIDADIGLNFDSVLACGDLTANVTASGNIDHIKYCPFCGKKLQED